jgi:hypothetical protein
LTLQEKTRVVIVLAQLDDTYFGGLEGGYGFDLQFLLEADDKTDKDDYIVRSNGNYAMARSVSTDIELEAGTYSVRMKLTATRNTDREHVEDVLPVYAATRREKLIQMGLSYDVAHAKGVQVETEAERKERKAREKERRAKTRDKSKNRAKSQAQKDWKRAKKDHELDKKRAARKNHWRERKARLKRDVDDDDDSIDRILRTAAATNGIAKRDIDETKKTADLPVNCQDKDPVTVEVTEEPAALPTREGKPAEEVSAVKVVEPLEEVIKAAGEAGQPAQPERAPEKDESQTTKPPPGASVDSQRTDADSTSAQASEAPVVTDIKPLATQPPRSHPEHEISNGIPRDTSPRSPNDQTNGGVTNIGDRQAPERSETMDSTAVFVGIGSGTNGLDLDEADSRKDSLVLSQPSGEAPPANLNGAGDVSDAETFPPFEWDSELDFPNSEDSDDSDESSMSSLLDRRVRPRYRVPYIRRGGRRRRSRSPPLGPPIPTARDYVEVVDPVGPGKNDEDDGPDETWNAVCVVGLRVYSTLKGEGVKLKVVKPSDFSDDEDDGKTPKGKPGREEKDRELRIDPDDMAKGAIAAEPESTGAVVDDGEAPPLIGATSQMKLGRRAGARLGMFGQ